MSPEEVQKLSLGVYLIHWKNPKEAKPSIATVGLGDDGRFWYAPADWVNIPGRDWSRVGSVHLLMTQDVPANHPILKIRRPSAIARRIRGVVDGVRSVLKTAAVLFLGWLIFGAWKVYNGEKFAAIPTGAKCSWIVVGLDYFDVWTPDFKTTVQFETLNPNVTIKAKTTEQFPVPPLGEEGNP